MRIFILCGLPGVGKTSICNWLSKSFPERFCYVNIAQDPLFRENAMSDIVIEKYTGVGLGRDLITEGHLERVIPREKFCKSLVNSFNLPAGNLKLVYLCCKELHALSDRRLRSIQDYQELSNRFEVGSHSFLFETFIQKPEYSIDECARRLFEAHLQPKR